MREQLNNNPLAQIAVIGVLLVGAGFFLMSTMGGNKEEGEAGATEATVTVAGSGASGTATGATPGEAVEGAIEAAGEGAAASASGVPAALPAPPPPRAVVDAFEANRTVVLLFVRKGGIDDRPTVAAVERLSSLPDVSTWVVPVDRIARYAAITQGVALDRVPALIVVRPKELGNDRPAASVSYGFQSPESVEQAVIDAGYKGKTLDYSP